MGAKSTKAEQAFNMTEGDKSFVYNAFMIVSGNKPTIRPENLFETWSYLVDPDFVQFAVDACFSKSNQTSIKVKPFAKFFYIAVKGHVAEQAQYISDRTFNVRSGSVVGVYTTRLCTFIESTIKSYFSILQHLNSLEYQSWVNKGIVISQTDATKFCQYMTRKINIGLTVPATQIEEWLYHHPLFIRIWQEVVIYLYSNMNPIPPPKLSGNKTLPFCNVPGTTNNYHSTLSIGTVMFINACLPSQYRFMWVPLFNSKLHGENFSQLVSRITHQGPTIVVVRDSSNHVFGAFAPASWRVGPSFIGDLTTTLFTLEPNMFYFRSSGYNMNFQYLNVNQQTMPNGMGFGGQLNYWGLWLDQKYGIGKTSVSCSTFHDYKQLTVNSEFKTSQVEIWCVDTTRKSTFYDPRDSLPPSVLARSLDRFMLEMSGHKFHSPELETNREKR